MLTPGTASDIRAAQPLREPLKASRPLLGEKAYDSDERRAGVNPRKTEAVIPNQNHRGTPSPFQKRRERPPKTIDRMVCRLKAARRLAPRDDKSAQTSLTASGLIAIVSWWLN